MGMILAIQSGATGSASLTVADEHTAARVGSGKIGVLVVALLIPLGLLGYFFVSAQNAEIAFARTESNGIHYYHPLEEITGRIAEHDALMAAYLAGDPSGAARLTALAILGLGAGDPRHGLAWMATAAVLVAFLSASQDIVIDAYRVELLEERQQGAGAAVVVIGYRLAMLASGAGALLIATLADWFWAYAASAACLLVGMATVLLTPEPKVTGGGTASPGGVSTWLKEAVVEPLSDFFHRNGLATATLILLFIMLYKLGDALLGTMTNPFYVELGFTKPEVAAIVKLYGLLATLLGGLLGGLIVHRRGVLPALWICGLIQMASNLIFVVQAWVGRDLGMLAVTISAENLAGGMGTTAFVAYLSSLCNLSYTATQYALLSSFMAQARTTLSAAGGFIAASTSWVGFFLITTLAAVPGLVLLLLLQRRLGGAMAARPQPGIVVEPG